MATVVSPIMEGTQATYKLNKPAPENQMDYKKAIGINCLSWFALNRAGSWKSNASRFGCPVNRTFERANPTLLKKYLCGFSESEGLSNDQTTP